MPVQRITSQISGAHRSVMLAAATSIPAAWIMGLLCAASVICFDSHLGGVHPPHAERQQHQSMSQSCSSPSLVGQLRCVFGLQQQQQLHQHVLMSGSVSWAAVAAHPGDLGLAVSIFLPQLLLLLLVAKLVASRCFSKANESGPTNAADATGVLSGNSSAVRMAAVASRPWAVRLLCDSGPTGGAAFLAVAKLLPLVCSVLTAITGLLGLRKQHPAGQALQLMHPYTSVAVAALTLLSQADAATTLVISVVHSVLAGFLLACHQGLNLPGYYSPLQAWLALVLLDVLLPAAVAKWRQQLPTAPATDATPSVSADAGRQSAEATASTTASTTASQSSTKSADASGTPLRHRRGSKPAAAEPASPAAALIAAAGYTDAPHSVRTSEDDVQLEDNSAHSANSNPMTDTLPDADVSAAAWDSPQLQPSTPSNSSDSAASPSRQHSASSAAAADAALAAFAPTGPQAAHIPQSMPAPTPTVHQAAMQLDTHVQPETPVMDFEEALAACARGAAARQASGLSPATSLYHSQYNHHVVSVKVSLDVALEGQELLHLVVNAIKATLATSTPSSPKPASHLAHALTEGPAAASAHAAHPLSPSTPAIHAGPLMLHPVAMRGCLHMLLPICFNSHSAAAAAAAASMAGKQVSSCVLGTAAAQALQQLSRLQQQQASTAAAAGSRQICIQVNGGSPQLIVKAGDGSWVLQTDNSTAATTPQSDIATTSSSSNQLPAGSSLFGTTTQTDAGTSLCWLEPPFILLAGSSSMPSTEAPYPTSKVQSSGAPQGTAHVTVHGLPAAAGGLVRVLLLQGPHVVSDQLLHTAVAGKQPSDAASCPGAAVDTMSVRLELQDGTSLLPGPAMVCVLAPPSSVAAATAAATAPAGMSPSVAALVKYHHQQASRHQETTSNSSSSSSSSTDANEQLKAARVWACLPLFCVSTTEAHQELNTFFGDMCAAATAENSASGAAGSNTDSSSSSSSSGVAPAVYLQHVQSFLWDCLFMAHGVNADSVLSCIPQLADKLKTAASSTGPLVRGLYERATVWALDTSSSSSGTGAAAAKQAITAGLLKLLMGRCMPATIQQLQAAVARVAKGNASGSVTAASATGSAAGQHAAGQGTKSLTSSPVAAPNQSSYSDSGHPSAGSLATTSLAGWHPPVHCRDAVSPAVSLQQQQQGAQLPRLPAAAGTTMVSVSAAEAGIFAAHRRHSAPTEAASFVPISATARHFPAAAQAAASAALFSAHRRLSMDNLPLPNTGYTGGHDLHPPRWSIDLPLPHPQLQQQQTEQQVFTISPTSLMGTPPNSFMGANLLNTTSPTGMAAAEGAGAGAASASYAAHMALQGWAPNAGMGPSSLLPGPDNAAAAAAAAAGAAAAQAALLHMQSGTFSNQGVNMQSPAVLGNFAAANAASGNGSRFAQQGSPMHPALAHMQSQSSLAHMRSQGSMGSLGYSPSLASSLGNSAFMTAECSGGLAGGTATIGSMATAGGLAGGMATAGAGGGGAYGYSAGAVGRSPPLPQTMQGPSHGAPAAGGDHSGGHGVGGGHGVHHPHVGDQGVGGGQRDEYGSVEGRHWAVFDTTGVEGFDAGAGMETYTTNLATTRRNNTSSVTWLAIPTSTTGLPPTGLQTPSTRKFASGSIHTSSTGKLRRSEQQHSYSSSLTPQPPRSQAFSHRTTGHTSASPEFATSGGSPSSSSSIGTIPMPHQNAGRRSSTRTMLFSPASDGGSVTAGSQYESCSPERASPTSRMGTGAAAAGSSRSSSGLNSRHLGGFGTPQRPGPPPAGLAAASPRRALAGLWSPGGPGHQLSTLPTIGSEDSWDQNAQASPSPRPLPAAGLMSPYIKGPGVNQGLMQSPVPPLPSVAAGGAVFGTPGPPSNRARGVLNTPRSSARPPVSATPRDVIYRSQTGSKTPGLYSSRAGNLVSGRDVLGSAGGAGGGGEGDTVSGVLQLLGQREGEPPNPADSNSGFSSDSSSLAGTPDNLYTLQQYNGGYFTPLKPPKGSAASLLPASARPAHRAPVWATPAAMSGRNVLTIPPGMSGSFLAAAQASSTGYAGAAAAGYMGQQQVPDTPLLRAGRNIAGTMFSPAPPLPLSMQQGQQQQQKAMSTPAHIQSLLPPPGSASKRKPAAAMLGSVAATPGSAGLSGGPLHTSSNNLQDLLCHSRALQLQQLHCCSCLLTTAPPTLGSTPQMPQTCRWCLSQGL